MRKKSVDVQFRMKGFDLFRDLKRKFVCLSAVLWCGLVQLCGAVEIRRLSVPRYIQNGSESAVVLDCEYAYSENDIRLVVKWFFEDNLEPVYQWIPQLGAKHTSGILRGRLDLDFTVNTIDAYSRYRALKIINPTTELSGKYTCLVTSLAGQDTKEQIMTVYVPADEFELGYLETASSGVNVSCDAQGVFPMPLLRLYVRPSAVSAPQEVRDARARSVRRPSGAFDVSLGRSFAKGELAPKGATVFECMLELPGTNYQQSKRIAYIPGIQGPRLETPYELSSISFGIHSTYDKKSYIIFAISFSTIFRTYYISNLFTT